MTEIKRKVRYSTKNASPRSILGMRMIPTCPSLTPYSPLSRTLRAACGGGLRPSWTAAALGVSGKLGRDEETVSFGRTKKPSVVRPRHRRGLTSDPPALVLEPNWQFAAATGAFW